MTSIVTLSTDLFPQILARREPRYLLEEAGEMMGKIEAQEARGFADVVAVHEQALGLVDDIVVDVADGRAACRLVDDVAEITRRIGQFRSAIGNGGQALSQLPILAEILLQQVVKAFQEVAAALVLIGELPLIDAVAVFQYQVQIAQQDASERGRVVVSHQLLPHLGEQLCDAVPFVRLHPKRASEEIREILVSVYLAFQFGAMQQFGRPQKRPSAQRDAFPIVFQAANLSRLHGNNRGIAHLQGLHAVREALRELALDKKSIDAVVVQAMAERSQFVEVDDADQRMQHRSLHISGKVIGTINFQDLLHRGAKVQ